MPSRTSASSPASTMGISPSESRSTRSSSMSAHTTSWPRDEKHAAVVRPTYPAPITAICAIVRPPIDRCVSDKDNGSGRAPLATQRGEPEARSGAPTPPGRETGRLPSTASRAGVPAGAVPGGWGRLTCWKTARQEWLCATPSEPSNRSRARRVVRHRRGGGRAARRHRVPSHRAGRPPARGDGARRRTPAGGRGRGGDHGLGRHRRRRPRRRRQGGVGRAPGQRGLRRRRLRAAGRRRARRPGAPGRRPHGRGRADHGQLHRRRLDAAARQQPPARAGPRHHRRAQLGGRRAHPQLELRLRRVEGRASTASPRGSATRSPARVSTSSSCAPASSTRR